MKKIIVERKKILIVEDDRNVSVLISMMLKSLKYDITGTAVSFEETISSIENNRPDLILMDIQIEGKTDGIDTALYIKNNFGIPVVFLTAFSDNSTIDRAKQAEPFGYLIKPFEISDIKSIVDITFNKIEYEKKLEESEVWFRSTLNSLGDGVIATDPVDNIKFINAVAENLLGYSLNEIKGKKLDEVYKTFPDITTEGLVYLFSESPGNFREAFLNNKILISRKGNKIPIEEKISSIKPEPGKTFGKVITFRDITLKREAQLYAMSAKDFYLNILEEFPVLIWRANKDKHFNYFNNQWLEFTGRGIDSEIFDGWFKNIHHGDREEFIELFEKSFKKREKFEAEIRLLNKDNTYHWLICFGNPFLDFKGNFAGYIGVCLDINNRKLLEEELRQSKLISDSSNKAKSAFISLISHEIRTPLNGIMGLTDLLLDSKLDAEQIDYLEMLKQSSHTLLNLLNNLLDYSKIEDNKVSVREEWFDVVAVAGEIMKPYKAVANRSRIETKFTVNGPVPGKLYGDELKVKQILSNLLGNAFKFTEKGMIGLVIDIEEIIKSSADKNDMILLRFTISDTGIGIPADKLNLVFESFTQVDGSRTRKYSGSGLGLTIVKRLVELLSGKIWIESKINSGTKIHFVLPMKMELPVPKKELKFSQC